MTKRILNTLAVATFVLGVGGFCLPAAADAVLKGAVKSSGGASLDGVVVSARHTGKTFTTTVFTDERGNYLFPAMQEGSYRVWAQAVGFETSRAELKSGLTFFGSSHSTKVLILLSFRKRCKPSLLE